MRLLKKEYSQTKNLKKHLLLKIEAIKSMIKENQNESEISYLEINLQLAKLALRNAEITVENHEKTKLVHRTKFIAYIIEKSRGRSIKNQYFICIITASYQTKKNCRFLHL